MATSPSVSASASHTEPAFSRQDFPAIRTLSLPRKRRAVFKLQNVIETAERPRRAPSLPLIVCTRLARVDAERRISLADVFGQIKTS
jgi:hypothetical protein